MSSTINVLLKKELFLNVDETKIRDGLSLVFAMSTEYRNVYKYYQMLKLGLEIKDDMMKMSEKNIALMYEYWCFIKLNSIIKEKYRLLTQDYIKSFTDGLKVALVKDSKSKISYKTDNGDIVELSYNSAYDTPTGEHKPDNVLSLKRIGNDNSSPEEYVFDAKYKIDYNNQQGYGPKEEDINTMHRYRDAICVEKNDSYVKTMIGAFVLFPYDDKNGTYRNHQFYKSISKVNIGGLPFLPKQTEYVKEILDKIIKSEDYHLIKLENATCKQGNTINEMKDMKGELDSNKKTLLLPIKKDSNAKSVGFNIWIKFEGMHDSNVYPKPRMMPNIKGNIKPYLFYGRKPSVNNGDHYFLSESIELPNGKQCQIIVGRGVLKAFNESNHSPRSWIESVPWMEYHPWYVEIESFEYIDAPIKKGLLLEEVIQNVGTLTYISTYNNDRNTDYLMKVHNQKQHMKLSVEAYNYINNRLDELFKKYGKIDLSNIQIMY